MGSYNVVVLPGDGVGPEVIREGMKALRAALNLANMDVRFTELGIGAERFQRTGVAFSPEDVCQRVSGLDM